MVFSIRELLSAAQGHAYSNDRFQKEVMAEVTRELFAWDNSIQSTGKYYPTPLSSLYTGRDNKILNLLSGMFLYGKVLYLLFAKSVF